jgi:hypothetical protein
VLFSTLPDAFKLSRLTEVAVNNRINFMLHLQHEVDNLSPDDSAAKRWNGRL